MQFLLAIYEDETIYAEGPDSAVWEAVIKAHTEFGEALAKAGVIRGGEGLDVTKTAKTVRTRAGQKSIHDGPFAETQEQLGGFYIIEVDTMDAALSWAAKVPVGENGSVEVRPTLGAMEAG